MGVEDDEPQFELVEGDNTKPLEPDESDQREEED